MGEPGKKNSLDKGFDLLWSSRSPLPVSFHLGRW